MPAQRRGYHVASRREHRARNGRPRGSPRPAGPTATPPPAPEPLREISEQAANELLAEAHTRLARPATLQARRGRIEREVVSAAEGMDVLILARDGDRERLGPRSIGPATRFVIDHAPCRLLLIWPDLTPELTTIPPPPPGAVSGE